MNKHLNIIITAISIVVLAIVSLISCKPGGAGKNSQAKKQDSTTILISNSNGVGKPIEIEVVKGKSFNHPSFAIWVEDTNGKYIQTLFVTKAIGQGIFEYGNNAGGTWKPGEVRRPAALPYWAHKRGIISDDGFLTPTPRNKIQDAYSGATPKGNFRLNSRADAALNGKVIILLEINQPWDWNEYWNNTRYPDDAEYKTSCQPAIVYSATIDFSDPHSGILMKPIGHSHYSGKTGELTTDLSTITTALHIAESITVTVK